MVKKNSILSHNKSWNKSKVNFIENVLLICPISIRYRNFRIKYRIYRDFYTLVFNPLYTHKKVKLHRYFLKLEKYLA